MDGYEYVPKWAQTLWSEKGDGDTSVTGLEEDNWRYVEDALSMTPLKPVLDAEPSYEGIPQGLHDPAQPLWRDCDVRRYGYWSVLRVLADIRTDITISCSS